MGIRDKESHDMTEAPQLDPRPIPEVHLDQAPLARVLAQARFPPILAISRADRVASFQEALRETYPNLSRDQVHSIELADGQTPNVQQGLIWRLADGETEPAWRVSLGVDFVALETSDYDSRDDFLARLGGVLSAVEESFSPAAASRLGVRYIDRLTGAAVERIGELIHAEILGVIQATDTTDTLDPSLGESIVHQITEAQFRAPGGARVQGRWGWLPANATFDPNALEAVEVPSWILDLDMFTTRSQAFASEDLVTTARSFAECLYWLFRQMVTMEFLRFHGGER